ncbi:MAG: hypothetical protein KF809_17940 [Chloroflexi bacterium]|nr:hypothetical protein [Chloroflexota bacterium]
MSETTHPQAQGPDHPQAQGPDVPEAEPSTRRSFLTAAAAALGAVAVQSVVTAVPTEAANGDPVRAGQATDATAMTTVRNTASGGTGIRGYASNTSQSTGSRGVVGRSDARQGFGVVGDGHTGVRGTGKMSNSYGVHGTGTRGVVGDSTETNGFGLHGTGHTGVRGVGQMSNSHGVHGTSSARGVFGRTTAGLGEGVRGDGAGANGFGIRGVATGTNGIGVQGTGTARGVIGRTSTRAGEGVRGESTRNDGFGVRGVATGTNGFGVHGAGHTGVRGVGSTAFNDSWGVHGTGTARGVFGRSAATNGQGIRGEATGTNGIGVLGRSTGTQGTGVQREATVVVGTAAGIVGEGAANTWAGYFQGPVHVAGTLTKSSGSFLIDHPLDPANRYLAHSFVESPDMLNVYSGTVTLNGRGRATVRLPRYYEALNADHRVQLTAVGAPAPDLHLASKVEGNRFVIAGGTPGLKVCWQVTGVRQDAWAREHPIKVDHPKPTRERGRYLDPGAHGKPRTAAIGHGRAAG